MEMSFFGKYHEIQLIQPTNNGDTRWQIPSSATENHHGQEVTPKQQVVFCPGVDDLPSGKLS